MDDKEFLAELERFNRSPVIPKPVVSTRPDRRVDVIDRGAEASARATDAVTPARSDAARRRDAVLRTAIVQVASRSNRPKRNREWL